MFSVSVVKAKQNADAEFGELAKGFGIIKNSRH